MDDGPILDEDYRGHHYSWDQIDIAVNTQLDREVFLIHEAKVDGVIVELPQDLEMITEKVDPFLKGVIDKLCDGPSPESLVDHRRQQ